MITAIILAGGLGTRLAQTVRDRPKVLAPIQGVPFLTLLLQQLEREDSISKIILALGHRAGDIKQFVAKRKRALSIEISIETSPLGTGGALLNALDKAHTDTLLVLNGDSYFDLPLKDFWNFHRTKNADISIACREVTDAGRYGTVEIDKCSQCITAFREKSQNSQCGWINAGLYLIQKSLLTSFTFGVYSLEIDFFPLFLKKNFFGYLHTGSFVDIGTPRSYNEAQEILKPWIA